MGGRTTKAVKEEGFFDGSVRSGTANPPGRLPGKASKESQVTVPQTDTGGRDEYSKALG